MGYSRRAVFLAFAGLAVVAGVRAEGPSPQAAPKASAAVVQDFLTVPPNITAEGLPPIPASTADTLAPYASSRRAMLLGWHPRDRQNSHHYRVRAGHSDSFGRWAGNGSAPVDLLS